MFQIPPGIAPMGHVYVPLPSPAMAYVPGRPVVVRETRVVYRHGALPALAAVAEVGSAAIVGAVVAGAILGGFGD